MTCAHCCLLVLQEGIGGIYELPHPLHLLNSPPTKLRLRKLVKIKITEYWQHFLAAEAMPLPSLSHFNPTMHSLVAPHPMWEAAGSNAYEVNKTTVLARMISGRYRTDSLCRYWSDNPQGYCLASTCNQTVGDLEHMLLQCPALQLVRNTITEMWLKRSTTVPDLQSLVLKVVASSAKKRMCFILDPTSMPDIVGLYQKHGMAVLDIVFYMTRTYAYGLHRKQLILRGKWPFSMKGENNCLKDQTNILPVSGPTASSLDASSEPLPTSTIARRPEVCCVPTLHTITSDHQCTSHVHHTSPVSTATSGQGRLSNHAMSDHSSECPVVEIMHHHIPVHAQQAPNMPVDSGRCAVGDSELDSSETGSVAADNQSTPTTSCKQCLQQRQDNAPVVMVGCHGGAVGGVHGALLCAGFKHTVGSSQPGQVFQLLAGTHVVCPQGHSRKFRCRLGEECACACRTGRPSLHVLGLTSCSHLSVCLSMCPTCPACGM